METNATSYIFWLFDWSTTEVVALAKISPSYIRCQITRQELIIEENPIPLRIPLASITDCSKISVHQGTYATSRENILIMLQPGSKITKGHITANKIYVAPMHVFQLGTQTKDIDDFITVLNAFKQNSQPAIHPNPYYLELQRQNRLNEFSEDKWDAMQPPYVHSPPLSIGKLLKYTLLLLLGIGVAIVVIMLIAALIANL